jgi:23S rRNA (adenine2503-C2)-methyltransferase
MVQTPLPLASFLESRRGLLELSPQELLDWLAQRGEKPWRARQLRHWLLGRGAESFDEMTDLPLSLRQGLAESFTPLSSKIARHLQASDDTHKLLVEFPDCSQVECVLIQEDQRRTACISTQVGCGMGCVFCASGLEGLQRNLTAAEILEQLLRLRRLPEPGGLRPPIASSGETLPRLTHIVVMGMGEPLANLENLLTALDHATSKEGLGLSARHVTISTVGLPARIRQLADTGRSYHLAVSLHAPNDALRNRIVPTNDKIGLEAILAAAEYFFARTGRQVTFEYVLLAGINDGAHDGRELARLLRGRRAHVNVIPFNEVEGLPYGRPCVESLSAFLAPLKQQGISVKVRKRKGAQIDAACGQLRRSSKQLEASN